MLLAIDSGNTNVVFGLYDGKSWLGEWRSASSPNRTADEYAVWLSQLMTLNQIDQTAISAAIIANVVPAATFSLKTLCRKYFNCEPLVVGEAGVELGVKVLLDRPEEVGADRVVNAVGAWGHHKLPAIIIDFGTATTFDIVDAEGNYHGGAIAPGINLSLEALHMAAAQLPRIAVKRPLQVIGKSTVAAMQSGVFWGYVGMIEGLVAQIRAEFGVPSLTVIATGGLAPLFQDATKVIDEVDLELTMRGLVEVYRRNRKT
ncbi:MAG TPA: type III pantothenate kinase [Alphaproteobacteria bacterium]|nr:type III pantothenate kinase [Alphaproteobacteria bacterium]